MNRILLRCPEIILKGKNQGEFRAALHDNVQHLLSRLGLRFKVRPERGSMFVIPPEPNVDPADLDRAAEALTRFPGVDSLSVGRWLPSETCRHGDQLVERIVEEEMSRLAATAFEPDGSYAVRANRIDKSLALDSQQLEIWLGGVLAARTGWQKVDLVRPDRTFYIDVHPDGVFLFDHKVRGVGGLPTGSGGHVLSLLSGGIDSPVSTYMLAKRGCSIDLFHMSATAPGDNLDETVVGRLARLLSRYTLRSRLFVAPYVYFDLALPGQRTGYELVLFRRFLLRVGEALAERIGAQALVAGDSLGQVASQTLDNMVSSSRAVDLPVLRPLVGLNKQEIIALARDIGTYETAIEPHKDCCALLSSHPRTRSTHRNLELMEADLIGDYRRLIDDTLAELRVLQFDCGDAVGVAEEPAAPPAAVPESVGPA